MIWSQFQKDYLEVNDSRSDLYARVSGRFGIEMGGGRALNDLKIFDFSLFLIFFRTFHFFVHEEGRLNKEHKSATVQGSVSKLIKKWINKFFKIQL